jgi:hypothetical protein
LGLELEVDHEAVYNNIDGCGVMFYLPVAKLMEEFSHHMKLDQDVWDIVHEVVHIFNGEGADLLVAKGAFTLEQLKDIQNASKCLDEEN